MITKYLLDTTAYSELNRGNKDMASLVNNASTIFLPSVVIAELRYGFRLGTKLDDNEKLLSRFAATKKVNVLLPDNATTDYFVQIAVFAHKKGVKLSTHDMWIAALAEQWEASLVSFDNDFKHLAYPGVKLWHPSHQ
jgi:tRNA(fMet)-specific endonuclease VapC